MSDILEPIFGPSGVIAARFLILLLLVLLILTLLVWLIGQLSTLRPSTLFRRKGTDRLQVIESVQVDGRRRAILLRRDNVEHLILTGGPTDIVVEHNRPGEDRQRPARAEPEAGTHVRRRPAQPSAERPAERHGPQRRPAGPRPGEEAAVRPAERTNPAAARRDQTVVVRPRQAPDATEAETALARRRDLATLGIEAPGEAAARPSRPPAGPGRPSQPPPAAVPPRAAVRNPAPQDLDIYAKPPRAAALPADTAAMSGFDDSGDAPVMRPTLQSMHHDADEEEVEAAAEFVAAAAPQSRGAPHVEAASDATGPAQPPLPAREPAPTRMPMSAAPMQPGPLSHRGEVEPQAMPDDDMPDAETAPEPSPFPSLEQFAPRRPRPVDDDDAGSTDRVGRLEEEMARLLGEITSRRQSGS